MRGLPRRVRHKMEQLFLEGEIRILVCTATLAWGVNLPANVVIVKGTTYYDPQKGSFVDVSVLDIIQIFGRAGRPQFDKEGRAILITSKDKLTKFTELLTDKKPIESQFLHSIADCLNAEINLGSIKTVEDGLAWIRRTFLYVRMHKNPVFYGLIEGKESVEDVLTDYLTLSLRRLQSCRMISVDGGSLVSREHLLWWFSGTELGRIASFYYIGHETLEIWLRGLRDAACERDVLFLLFDSAEFRNIIYRAEEAEPLKHLAELLEIEFEETKRTKLLILVMAAFRKIPNQSFSLSCDQNYVIHNMKRLLQALILVLISERRFDLFTTVLFLQHRARGAQKCDVVQNGKLFPYRAGNFLHINIAESCANPGFFAEKGNKKAEQGPSYALLEEEGRVLFVMLLTKPCDFLVPFPGRSFVLKFGGLEKQWTVQHQFFPGDVCTLSPQQELLNYGTHLCQDTGLSSFFAGLKSCRHFKVRKGEICGDKRGEMADFLANVARSRHSMVASPCGTGVPECALQGMRVRLCFVPTTDHKEEEINTNILHLIVRGEGRFLVVAGDAERSARTRKFLRREILREGRRFAGHGEKKAQNRTNRGDHRFAVVEEATDVEEGRHVIFRGFRTQGGAYRPVSEILRVVYRCPATIFETRDFCDFLKSVFDL